MRLRLWHEVFLPSRDGEHSFEYLDCHPNTGLLPFVAPTGLG